MDALEIAKMRGAGADGLLALGLGPRRAAATAGLHRLDPSSCGERGAGPTAAHVFTLCSHFLNVRTICQEIFLIFMIALILKSRINSA
jgi:hypothetical protein